ncbi:MAG: low molecular weight phosphotyrosine protein phosphatase, partial [Gemmatimonadota bacterium]|nr:low molecular weight phosphotyrosine protein phosphatase [Gemmatimonadota bacterium]
MDSKPRGSPETAVLFVCLGNICRSPLAEGVFRHLVQSDGLKHRFHIDSAGTGAWHVGEAPDGRATVVAARHGVELHGQARQIQTADLHRFDFIIVMDRDNLDNVERLAEGSGSAAQIRLL